MLYYMNLDPMPRDFNPNFRSPRTSRPSRFDNRPSGGYNNQDGDRRPSFNNGPSDGGQRSDGDNRSSMYRGNSNPFRSSRPSSRFSSGPSRGNGKSYDEKLDEITHLVQNLSQELTYIKSLIQKPNARHTEHRDATEFNAETTKNQNDLAKQFSQVEKLQAEQEELINDELVDHNN